MLNSLNLHGRLTKKPELEKRQTAGGSKSFVRVNLAVDRVYKGSDNKPQTDFFSLVAWGQPAETLAKYTDKGSELLVFAHVRNNNRKGRDGNMIYQDEYVLDRFDFCGNKKQNTSKPIEKKVESDDLFIDDDFALDFDDEPF